MSELHLSPKDFNPHILFFYKRIKSKEEKVSPLHTHDYLFINYITSGFALYTIGDETYSVGKGEVVVINAHVPHCRESIGDEFTVFDMGITNFKRCHLPCNHFIENDTVPIIKLFHSEVAFYDCYREILLLQASKEIGWKLMVKTLIMKQLVFLLRESLPHQAPSKSGYVVFDSYEKESITENMIAFILENYKSKITLDNLTKNSYLSSVYLSKVFKEATGETPINYLIKVRINKAKELLAEKILSMKEIAIEVGYEDYYYFSKLFKKNTGFSPRAYLRELGEDV